MAPPGHAPLAPEVARVGATSSVGLGIFGFVMTALILMGVAAVILANEAIGPLITFAVWLAFGLFKLVVLRRGIYASEALAIVGCLVTLQLLLDMLHPYLGDIVIAVLHVLYVAAVLWDRLRCSRDRQGRDHEQL